MTQNGSGYTKNGGPPCPKIERLEELMDIVTKWKDIDEHQDWQELVQEVVEALDWTHTMLANRKTYQKKQQITKKVTFEIAKKMLGEDEMAAIQREATRRLAEEVSK